MAQILFPNFLKDKEVYLLARAFWQEQFDQFAQKHGLEYVPYLNDTPLEFDGNPIFNAWGPAINRGVRIIQVEPESEEVVFSAWLDTVETEEGKLAIDELVIDLVLSEETNEAAFRLILNWLEKRVEKEEIERLIEMYLKAP